MELKAIQIQTSRGLKEYPAVEDCFSRIRDGSFVVPHEYRADAIVRSCIDSDWEDEVEVSALKHSIVYELQRGASHEAIDAIVSDFVDERLAEEEPVEAEEDREIALWRLEEETERYKSTVDNAAQLCLSKQLVWGIALNARCVVARERFPTIAGAIYRPRISSAQLCIVARRHLMCFGGLLRSLVHRLVFPRTTKQLSRIANINRRALAYRACNRSLVALISRIQIRHNVDRWRARLSETCSRFVQRSSWAIDDEESGSCDEGQGQESAFKIENRIELIEDLVSVG